MSKKSKENWSKIAARILKKELKKEKITYNELCKRLAKIGINKTFGSISNKISRDTFSFIYFYFTWLTLLDFTLLYVTSLLLLTNNQDIRSRLHPRWR